MRYALALLSSLLALRAVDLYRNEWRHTAPVIPSEALKLSASEADELLEAFCATKIRAVAKIGLECTTRNLGPRFRGIVDNRFTPESVIYGNFLGPEGEDAAVSGWSAEHHPELWRGTLMLTKRQGRWTPVWYKSSVITHSCRKLSRPDKRQILLCEEEDGGMGHRLHYLYSVDLTSPKDIREGPLFAADSFESSCVVHLQRIVTAEWDQAAFVLGVKTATPTWRTVLPDICPGDPEHGSSRPHNGTIRFALTDSGFRRR
jgi:hypothetical protein